MSRPDYKAVAYDENDDGDYRWDWDYVKAINEYADGLEQRNDALMAECARLRECLKNLVSDLSDIDIWHDLPMRGCAENVQLIEQALAEDKVGADDWLREKMATGFSMGRTAEAKEYAKERDELSSKLATAMKALEEIKTKHNAKHERMKYFENRNTELGIERDRLEEERDGLAVHLEEAEELLGEINPLYVEEWRKRRDALRNTLAALRESGGE